MSRLIAIVGPMFAAKSALLVEKAFAARAVGLKAECFRPASDTRTGEGKVESRFGPQHRATLVGKPGEILEHSNDLDMVAIDEAQLFTEGLYLVVETLLQRGEEVIVSGLDRDYRGLIFPEFAKVIARADELIKLTARCHICARPAIYTQRLHSGQPVENAFEETIVIEGATKYQARCERCFVPPENIMEYIALL